MRREYAIIRCDHPAGCAHSITAATLPEAIELARRTGWTTHGPDLCPTHTHHQPVGEDPQ